MIYLWKIWRFFRNRNDLKAAEKQEEFDDFVELTLTEKRVNSKMTTSAYKCRENFRLHLKDHQLASSWRRQKPCVKGFQFGDKIETG